MTFGEASTRNAVAASKYLPSRRTARRVRAPAAQRSPAPVSRPRAGRSHGQGAPHAVWSRRDRDSRHEMRWPAYGRTLPTLRNRDRVRTRRLALSRNPPSSGDRAVTADRCVRRSRAVESRSCGSVRADWALNGRAGHPGEVPLSIHHTTALAASARVDPPLSSQPSPRVRRRRCASRNVVLVRPRVPGRIVHVCGPGRPGRARQTAPARPVPPPPVPAASAVPSRTLARALLRSVDPGELLHPVVGCSSARRRCTGRSRHRPQVRTYSVSPAPGRGRTPLIRAIASITIQRPSRTD